jgi:hypothetical protein
MDHGAARRILFEAWRSVHGRVPTGRELDYAQAIALLESHYGDAFAVKSGGLRNWGAEQQGRPVNGACPPGMFIHADVDAKGRPSERCFFGFTTDEQAAAHFLHILTQTHWPFIAAANGTPVNVALALKNPPPYYEADATAYARAIGNALATISHALSPRAPAVPAGGAPARPDRRGTCRRLDC